MYGPNPNSIPMAPKIMPNGITGIIKGRISKNLEKIFFLGCIKLYLKILFTIAIYTISLFFILKMASKDQTLI